MSAKAKSGMQEEQVLSGLEGLLEIVGFEAMVESVRAAVHIQTMPACADK